MLLQYFRRVQVLEFLKSLVPTTYLRATDVSTKRLVIENQLNRKEQNIHWLKLRNQKGENFRLTTSTYKKKLSNQNQINEISDWLICTRAWVKPSPRFLFCLSFMECLWGREWNQWKEGVNRNDSEVEVFGKPIQKLVAWNYLHLLSIKFFTGHNPISETSIISYDEK